MKTVLPLFGYRWLSKLTGADIFLTDRLFFVVDVVVAGTPSLFHKRMQCLPIWKSNTAWNVYSCPTAHRASVDVKERRTYGTFLLHVQRVSEGVLWGHSAGGAPPQGQPGHPSFNEQRGRRGWGHHPCCAVRHRLAEPTAEMVFRDVNDGAGEPGRKWTMAAALTSFQYRS